MAGDMFDATKRRAQAAATHNGGTPNPHALETTQRALAARDQHAGAAAPSRKAVAAVQRAAVSGAQFDARVDASFGAMSTGGAGAFDAGHQTAILQAKQSMANEFLSAQREFFKTAPPFMQDQMRNVRMTRAGLAPMPVRGRLEDID